MIIPVAEALGKRLQGRLHGRRDFARLCELMSAASPGEVVYLDFAGVDLVTGSWVHAALVPLIRWAADERNDLFPVIFNARSEWLDDLALVAEFAHQCYLVAEGQPASRARLVGSLDPGQRTTLEALLELDEATGAELERQRPGDGIKATAWNNRLRDLYEKRLLRRVRHGREQRYSPVVQEVMLG
jgi:hypothetical protein